MYEYLGEGDCNYLASGIYVVLRLQFPEDLYAIILYDNYAVTILKLTEAELFCY